uniref:Alpha/beta hydrolase fold-3 domain-containing protein n=1 Tax=Setaria digitata TaxID=48799 RepID=A0A915PV65_9BILA
MSCRHGVQCTETECLYSPSHWSASLKSPDLVIKTFITAMKSCYQNNQRTISLQQAIPYGDGKQRIDIWGDEIESTTAMVLFHGGYWQEGDRELFTSPVKALIDKGFVVASVGYDFATVISLNNVIDQATKALSFLAKRWPWKKLAVGGHSAGAHLVISALKRLEDAYRYQKIVLFSGIYDLQPLVGTYIGEPINLSFDEAKRFSIISMEEISAELLVIVGGDESPQFKEQSQQIVQNYLEAHHFDKTTAYYKVATVPPVMKTRRTDKTQSSTEYVPVEKEEDSFAKKTPVKRLAKRSIEIRSKAPVDREREDYKTFSGIKLPMSDADLDK